MKIISTSDTLELVDITEIIYIEGYENYSKVHLVNDRTFLTKQTLKSFNEDNAQIFCRTHISYVINISKVIRFHKEGIVELIKGIKLPVARRRKKDFLLHLEMAVEKDLF